VEVALGTWYAGRGGAYFDETWGDGQAVDKREFAKHEVGELLERSRPGFGVGAEGHGIPAVAAPEHLLETLAYESHSEPTLNFLPFITTRQGLTLINPEVARKAS
jgi:hypothetical protein